MQTVRLLFSTTGNPFSALIRAATWSRWSHVSIIDDGDMVIEAAALHGVRRVSFVDAINRAADAALVELPSPDAAAVIAAAASQIGKPYDYTAILGLGLRRDWQEEDSWFCSELVAWAFQRAGEPLFRAECLRRVTPQHLWMLAPAPPPPDPALLAPHRRPPRAAFFFLASQRREKKTMAEPTSSAAALAAATATGLTVFGVATGLHPAILLAGLAGGLWALSYQEPAPAWKRVAITVMASVVAGYLAPAVAAGVTALDAWPHALTRDLVQLPIAVLIGLLSHRVLGPALLRIAAQKAEEVSK